MRLRQSTETADITMVWSGGSNSRYCWTEIYCYLIGSAFHPSCSCCTWQWKPCCLHLNWVVFI